MESLEWNDRAIMNFHLKIKRDSHCEDLFNQNKFFSPDLFLN